jgi:uncharacterized repeat protein (TIGR03803 family)
VGGGTSDDGTIFQITASGTLTTLLSFDYTDGEAPSAALIQGTNGNFYGTTIEGGANGYGTVFKITPSGTLMTLHDFNVADGEILYGALVQDSDGKFYGTTVYGGTNGNGTVFSITPDGNLTTLHSFDGTDGSLPYGTLVQGTDGKFYGTTAYGGTNGNGTVFSITKGGVLTTLHKFDGVDGSFPTAELVQGTDGKFYGATYSGGPSGSNGTVFSITASGMLMTLYNFCSQSNCSDGRGPWAGLIQGTDGMFYGTTVEGGTGSCSVSGCGTVFSITKGGVLTTLYSFQGADGRKPYAALIQGTDGMFYGTTEQGGHDNAGRIFSITPTGTLTTLHKFMITDGENSYGGLIQDTNGTFYGTTAAGGANFAGTVFSLSVGLGPFVEANPTAGRVGKAVRILGTNLTGTTSVTFNGTAATFTVVSSSEITTTVPTGATTGTVKVVTPGGTLSSNVNFTVN